MERIEKLRKAVFKSFIFLMVAVVPFCLPSIGNSNEKLTRVLFLGNSLSGKQLPELIKNIAESNGHFMEYNTRIPGGYTFEQHASDPVTIGKIEQGNWDFVVLQEQSQLPAFGEDQVKKQVFSNAKKLSEMIRSANPQAQVVFYLTMARKYGDFSNVWISPGLATYEGMQKRITKTYKQMTRDNKTLLAPVGMVWEKVRSEHPDIELYSDEVHPNITGTYLTACVMYSTLFNDAASKIGNIPAVSTEESSAIRKIVDEVQQSLNY